MAGLGVKAACDALKTGGVIGGKELLQAFAVGADRIARTGDDINRQLLRNTYLARRFCYLAQGIQQINPELKRGPEAAERIGDVLSTSTEARDDTHGDSQPDWLAVRAGEHNAGECLTMLADEVLRHKRAHGMADEHDWQARVVDGDALVQAPEIVYAFAPAALSAKKPRSSGVATVRPWPRLSPA